MTVSIAAQGRAAKIRSKLSTTAATTVYTCPADRVARAIGISCVNTSGGSVDVTITVVDAAAVIYTFCPTQPVAVGDTLDLDFNGHPLIATETIKVQASGANAIQVWGVVLEANIL